LLRGYAKKTRRQLRALQRHAFLGRKFSLNYDVIENTPATCAQSEISAKWVFFGKRIVAIREEFPWDQDEFDRNPGHRPSADLATRGAYSGLTWAPIPAAPGQRFRNDAGAYSGSTWALIPA